MPARCTPSLSSAMTLAASFACAAALLASAPATAQSPGAQATAVTAALNSDDRHFIEEAGVGGMAEVQLGKLAQERGADPQVKAFGEKMVQDHGKAYDELARLAAAKGVQIPPQDRKHRKDAEKLAKKSGADFDKAYMDHMVDDHKKDIRLFEKAARSAKDPELRAFASQTLPTLQAHLQHAQTTHAAVKGKR